MEKILKSITIFENQTLQIPDLFFAKVCLSRIYALNGQEEKATEVITECMNLYFAVERETDFITYLILDTLEKICGNLTDEMLDELDDLYRYEDYEFFISHNNNSQVLLIPNI